MKKMLFLAIALVMFATLSLAEIAHGQDHQVFWYQPIRYGSSSEPLGALIQGRDGFLYGGADRTIFRLDTSGLYTPLQTLPIGYSITGRFVEGSDGFFYGTAVVWNGGMVFKMAPDGAELWELHSFDRYSEGRPFTGLVEGRGGFFYGILPPESGGPRWGSIFRIGVDGVFEMLVLPPWYTGPGGGSIGSHLVAGRDGSVYGITGRIVFRIETTGVFTPLYEFPATEEWEPRFLSAGLDGFIYGIASKAGATHRLFKIDVTGVRTWVAYVPSGTYWLAQGHDGLLYGIMEESQMYPYGGQELFGLFRLELQPSGVFLARYLQTFQIFNINHETVSLLDTVHGEDGFIYGTVYPPTAPEEQFFFRLGTSAQFFAGLEQQLATARQTIATLTKQVNDLTFQNDQLQGQLTQLNNTLSSNLKAVQANFRSIFGDPSFTIPGSTNLEQYQNLIQAILNLNKGRKQGLYQDLGGKK